MSSSSVGYVITVFMGFFAIMNPIANTPVFLALTKEDDQRTKKKIAAKALTLAFFIVAVFAIAGKLIFELFGITLPAFQITGGLVVFIIGYNMLQGGEHSPMQHPSEQDTQKSLDAEMDVAITPLGMPILAGPGTIATAMNFASAGGVRNLVVTIVAFLALCIISYFSFIFGGGLVKRLGENGIKVVTRLMGLILAAIGVQMLIQGITSAITQSS